jgi:hypothetical protein
LPGFRQGHRDADRFNLPGWGYPWFYDGAYPGFYGDIYQQPQLPSVIVLMPRIELPAPPAPPPPPVRPEIREYQWPTSNANAAVTAFSIVSKDQQEQSAVAVWVQDGVLRYVAPDGSCGRMPLDSVDRKATRERNARQQLTLALPPSS